MTVTDAGVQEGDPLWVPSEERRKQAKLTAYLAFLERTRGLRFADYFELHAFSTREISAFWRSIWDYFEVIAASPPTAILSGHLPHAHWFDGARLNYAQHALRRNDEHPALVYRSESGERTSISYAELRTRVARARAGLVRLGVGPNDRVAALVGNRPEAVIAFLATASLGAVWSSCSPEFGTTSVLDRFRQLEPKVLLAATSYEYGGKHFDRGAEVSEIRAGLPKLGALVTLGEPISGALSWDELSVREEPLEFCAVGFEHPLWVLYSSGTTGLPKAIVHGHGGMLLEHFKALALHADLGPADRFFWFTTTGWMMWNFLVSGLLLGSTIVLYDGSPAFPDLDCLWRLVEEEGVTYFGTSAPYLLACQKAGVEPRRFGLGQLRSLGTTGAPLPTEGFGWVYEHVKRDLLLGSISGGTDVCTAFVLSCPLLPVRAGELQCAGLGAKVESFDADGRPLLDQVGELVLTEPLPCMPIRFLNDPGDQRRIESYFSTFAGVWRHGDWVKATRHGGFVIYGRSDSTLNRGGVRMGTSEFYGVVEALPEVLDSLVVDTGSLASDDGKLWLFIVPRSDVTLDETLRKKIKTTLRSQLSPRHVPDEIVAISCVPRTLNGKKLEVPVKRILTGTPESQALSQGTLSDPTAIEPFVALARAEALRKSPNDTK
jgi:acetoacetyl-CoA synthetase